MFTTSTPQTALPSTAVSPAAPSVLQPDTPIAEGQTNRTTGSVVKAPIAPEPLLFFRPATAEIVMVEPKDAAAFLSEIAAVDSVVTDLMEARIATEAAQDKLFQSGELAPPELQLELSKAMKAEEKAREKADAAFKAVKMNPGADLMELLPLWSVTNPKGLPRGKKFTYVRSERVESRWRGYPLAYKDRGDLKPFLIYDPRTKKWKLDQEKLKNGFKKAGEEVGKKFKELKIKGERDLGKIETEWSPSFVEAFNKNAKFVTKENEDDLTEFSASARLLRCFAGASGAMEGELSTSMDDILKGKLKVKAAVKGRAEAGLTLAEGRANFKLMLPHRSGLKLMGIPAVTKDHRGIELLPMGYFRLLFDLGVEGTVGASVLAEGGIELEFNSDGVQQLKGRALPKDAQAVSKKQLKVNDKSVVSASANAKAEITAFAGASAGGSVKGAFQWQKPESKEFGDFALIEPKIAGLAGLGGTAAFSVGYFPEVRKFKAKVTLAGCVGLGLSGKIGAEIGAGQILEFASWYKHQVVAAMDQNLGYLNDVAFKAFCAMYTLAIVEGKQLADYLGQEAVALEKQLQVWINQRTEQFLAAIEASKDVLVYSLAEVKGYILQALKEIQKDFIEYRDRVQKTMRWLLGSIYYEAEFNNVFQHATYAFGEKADAELAKRQVAQLVGGDTLASVEQRLKRDTTIGFAFVRNDDPGYAFQRGVHVAWNDKAWWANGALA